MPTAAAKKNSTNPVLIAFGKRVVELRKQAGMTQEDLAGLSGFDRTYISGVENAKRNVSLTALFKLAGALGAEPQQLVDLIVIQDGMRLSE